MRPTLNPVSIAGTICLSLLWAYPSAFFLPVISGDDSWLAITASVTLTLLLGLLVTCFARHARRIDGTWAVGLPVGALVFSSVLIVPIYLLLAKAGIAGGLGGDRGQALDIAIERAVSGLYPYAALTYDGGQITPLPGALLLASPARLLLGDSGLMTAYLIPLAVLVLWRVNRRLAAVVSLATVLAPAFWADTLSHGDLVSTSILGFAVACGALSSVLNDSRLQLLWAAALGLVATTRVTSLVVILVVVAVLAARGFWRSALSQGVVALGVAVGLVLPVYLINAAEFSPLHTSSFLRGTPGVALAGMMVGVLLLALFRLPWAHWWAPSQLGLALAILSVGLTTIPVIVDFGVTTLLTTGYAVTAVVAPVAMLSSVHLKPYVRNPHTPRTQGSTDIRNRQSS